MLGGYGVKIKVSFMLPVYESPNMRDSTFFVDISGLRGDINQFSVSRCEYLGS